MSFVDAMLARLEEHPDRAFVTDSLGERLVPTRGGRLREMVEQARRWLRQQGVGPGDRVAIVAPVSARWVALDLAILAEGATSVPLDAHTAPGPLAARLRDCDPRLAVVEDATVRDALADRETSTVLAVLDAVFAEPPPERCEPARALGAAHVVTIVYTSGASGEPRGVMTTVANVEHVLGVLDGKLRDLVGVGDACDRALLALPPCSAASRMLLWACLLRARGICPSRSDHDIDGRIRLVAPALVFAAPAVLEGLRERVEAENAGWPRPLRALYARAIEAFRREREGVAGKRDRAALLAVRTSLVPRIRARCGPSIRAVLCASAPLSAETQAWFCDLVGLPVHQMYGLAETTGLICIDRVGSVVAGRVGHPIPGCEVKIGPGGELLVRGPNLFAGYFRRPEATEQAWTDGWLRTGDRARLDERGALSILGRIAEGERSRAPDRHAPLDAHFAHETKEMDA